LPKPDIAIFLHMPYDDSRFLRENRDESLDQLESNEEHLKRAENAYQELAQTYHWKTIECAKDHVVRTIEDIHEEIYQYMKQVLKEEK